MRVFSIVLLALVALVAEFNRSQAQERLDVTIIEDHSGALTPAERQAMAHALETVLYSSERSFLELHDRGEEFVVLVVEEFEPDAAQNFARAEIVAELRRHAEAMVDDDAHFDVVTWSSHSSSVFNQRMLSRYEGLERALGKAAAFAKTKAQEHSVEAGARYLLEVGL